MAEPSTITSNSNNFLHGFEHFFRRSAAWAIIIAHNDAISCLLLIVLR
jgi:hypothetical protein